MRTARVCSPVHAEHPDLVAELSTDSVSPGTPPDKVVVSAGAPRRPAAGAPDEGVVRSTHSLAAARGPTAWPLLVLPASCSTRTPDDRPEAAVDYRVRWRRVD